MQEISTNLIEVTEGSVGKYKISTTITHGGEPVDKEGYFHAKHFLGKSWLHIFKDLPDKSVLKFNIENQSAKEFKDILQTIYVQYSPTNPFVEIVNKVDDGIGFYGNFKIGNKSSKYILEEWKISEYKG
jgi:hypothetical protein